MNRKSGILMSITSLPSRYGIGTIGKEAYKFADFLKEANQSYWQILPIGPTGYGNSPYTSYSTYAGNPYLIDLDLLIEEGLLKKEEVSSINWGKKAEFVDYSKVIKNKINVLEIAYKRFIKNKDEMFDKFIESQSFWLDDYALYMAIIEYKFKGIAWNEWPDEDIKLREKSAIEEYNNDLIYEVQFYKFMQYIFFRQWKQFKEYVNSTGVEIIGDIPIYVPLDSSDVWANKEEFLLDEKGYPKKVSGCPPDAFSEDGQLWGHPIYDWAYMRQNDYEWWMSRINALSNLYDVTRIDHFRAFDTYYSIPNDGEKDAVKRGEWLEGPGEQFFVVLREKLGNVNIIAEDLGSLASSVEVLLKKTGYPGMKVLILALDSRDEDSSLPYSYDNNYVIYTGTHDNDTVMGWINDMSEQEFNFVSRYCTLSEKEGYNWGMIRTAFASVCDTAIIPMQDVLGLDNSARMNIPSYVGENWSWRLKGDADLSVPAKKLVDLGELYGRNMETANENPLSDL